MPAKFGFKIQLVLARGETFFFFLKKNIAVFHIF